MNFRQIDAAPAGWQADSSRFGSVAVKDRMRSFVVLGALGLAISLSGCSKEATGQVVAVVNGEEITLQELNAELADLKVPENADKKAIRARVLQQLVDRRLLAMAAKESGLDRDSEYILQQRRANERLLVSMYAKKALDTIRVPDQAAIDKYVREHPTMFGSRTRYTLDQIQFEMPNDTTVLKAMEADKTLDAVAARLTAANIKFARGSGAMDSAGVPAEILKQITALPPGEPFVVPDQGRVVVSVITGQEPLAVNQSDARALAVQAMRAESLRKVGDDRLKEARAKAKVEYQPGYEPAAEQTAKK